MRKCIHRPTNYQRFPLVDDSTQTRHKTASCRSTLTFVTSDSTGESIDFSQLERVRRPVSRSKAGVQGKIADVFFNRSRHAESKNELNGFRVMLATAHADSWQEQPFFLDYHHEGEKHRYTPDILVVWGEHQEVVDIKEDAEADLPENQIRFALIRELLAEHNYNFRVWRKSEIAAEPRLTNVGLVLRYRSLQISPIEQEGIRRMFSSKSQAQLRLFCEAGIPVQSVLRTVLDGTLHINWWQSLDLNSWVSAIPIGSQVWPSRPSILRPAPLEEISKSLRME